MESERTLAWRWTRILLAVGIVSVVIIGLAPLLAPPPFQSEAIWVGPLLIWSFPGMPIAALLIALVGLIWMIRIFREQGDELSRWRNRDR